MVSWGDGVNLVLGANGQGKTNLLEAICVLCNLRSFRVRHWTAVARHGERQFRVGGDVSGTAGHRKLEHILTLGPPVERLLLVDGCRVTVPEYLAVCPVFALTAMDRELVSGSPQIRRQFLDRLAFHLDPDLFSTLTEYRQLLRQRNAGLGSGVSDDELRVWEMRLAETAGRLVDRRRRVVERLRPEVLSQYRKLADESFPELALEYRGEGGNEAENGQEAVAEILRERYNATRARDRQVGYTVAGPHRHDLTLFADGRPVRNVLSSGQTKVVGAALRLATVAVLERERGERLPVLVDDADAELDPLALRRLGETLADGGQVIFSSAGAQDVTAQLRPARTFWIRGGVCNTKAPPETH